MEAPVLDADTLAYVRRVHGALGHKAVELDVMSARFEPPQPLLGGKTARPVPNARQRMHVLRRYDEALSYFRGFQYNPWRAYFDRDAYGSGLLQFEDGVSLLGTAPGDDRWAQQGAVSETRTISRAARLDAFLAMLERRQALTELVGMAPTCIFVGEQIALDILRDPERRGSPRPPHRRIRMHRYRRLCFSAQSRSQRFGFILCPTVAERRSDQDGWMLHVLCSGSAVQQNPGGTGWRAQVIIDVRRQWDALVQRRFFAVFDRSPTGTVAVRKTPDGRWPLACPQGDAQMVHRLALLLDSPNLDYAPWDLAVVGVGRLSYLLDQVPMAEGGTPMNAGEWMRYSLLSRVYPYAMLATKDMRDRMHYDAYTADTRLTMAEQGTFRESVRPAADTFWVPLKGSGKGKGKAAAIGDPLPIGVKGRRRRQGRKGVIKEKTTVEISAPRTGPGRRAEVAALIKAPSPVQSARDAREARFLSLRRAEEATSRLEPFYVVSGAVWPPVRAYTVAKEWRRAVMTDAYVLWAVGLEALTLLFGARAERVWQRAAGPAPKEEALRFAFRRAVWPRRLEDLAPKPMTAEYRALATQSVTIAPFVSRQTRAKIKRMPASDPRRQQAEAKLEAQDKDRRDRARHGLLGLARTDVPQGGVRLLMTIARGVSPPDRAHNQADLQIMALAVITSLVKESALYFAPSATYLDPDSSPRPPLEAEIERWTSMLPADDGQEPDEKGIEALRAMASMTLLAWEWGGWTGMHRLLRWFNARSQGRDVAGRLISTWSVLADLTQLALERRTLRPTKGGGGAILGFVQELHGYGGGDFVRLFGDAAQRGDSANALIDGGQLVPTFGGMGTDPQPDDPYMWAGFRAQDVRRVSRAQVVLRYAWASSALGDQGASSGAVLCAARRTHLIEDAVRAVLQYPAIARALRACGHTDLELLVASIGRGGWDV